MQSLIQDSRYFAQIDLPSFRKVKVNWSSGVTRENVTVSIRALLGSDFSLREPGEAKDVQPTGLALFDMLTQLLPEPSSQLAFFWRKVGYSFASMLDTARFPIQSQANFLIWFHARVIGFMGPEDGSGVGSIMTIDKSPIELSWVIPNRTKPAKDDVTRQIRFAIEPIDPRNGTLLAAAPVMNYLVSPLGSLGVVQCEEGGMNWRKTTEDFLFPNSSEDVIPEGSRFFVGFDFKSSGTLTLKAYYLTASRPTSVSLSGAAPRDAPFPIYCGDADFTPLRQLVPKLDAAMSEPLETMIEYFESLENRLKPRIQILAMDCVPSHANRLKIYCVTMEGTSWSDAKRTFTLGGRLTSSDMEVPLARLESLWNEMFPNATSSKDCELVSASAVDADHDQEAENDPDKPHDQHPRGGLLFYYELVAGKNTVSPKIYLPVRHYCENDQVVSDAVEAFYSGINIEGPEGGETGPGWVGREVAKAYNHRSLKDNAGVQTYITFAVKGRGWELTDYFSPELWV